MNKNIYKIFAVLLVAAVISSCSKKEAALTPSDGVEIGIEWPQGNNDYDQRIANYYNRFGTFLLYKFNDKDAYWSVISWDTTYKLTPADPAYINRQLDLLDTTFFRYYADSTLRNYLPAKILLSSSITLKPGYNVQQDAYLLGDANNGYVYGNFPVNWGSRRILNIKGVADSAALFRGNVNYSFLRLATLRDRIPRPAGFDALSDYIGAIATYSQAYYYQRGYIGAFPYYIPGAPIDWENYLKAIVKNPYSYLTDATGITSADATLKGILSPVKDVSGNIRRKYDFMINFYKNNYNIDLQRIGNGDK